MPTLAPNNLQSDDPNDQPKIVPCSTNRDLEGGIGALHQTSSLARARTSLHDTSYGSTSFDSKISTFPTANFVVPPNLRTWRHRMLPCLV